MTSDDARLRELRAFALRRRQEEQMAHKDDLWAKGFGVALTEMIAEIENMLAAEPEPVRQRAYGEWAMQTFPHATSASTIAHLVDEVQELSDAVGTPGLPEEAADCLLLLMHLAHRNGFDLVAAADQKFAINKNRTWNTPTDRGYTRHDPDPATDAGAATTTGPDALVVTDADVEAALRVWKHYESHHVSLHRTEEWADMRTALETFAERVRKEQG